ncbi:hypothetical protein M3Y95_00402900 [Aphelenchoides besseyi]|nr:hypothetical protein M3Y95_00402900 [Aphelenchoides besseyi]
MQFVSIATICGVIYSMVLNLCTFPLLAAMIWTNWRNERVLSPHFIVNLCTYLLGIVFCIPYTSYVAIGWRGDESHYSMLAMFWTGTFFYAHAAALSTSVLFLIWDRSFSLMFPITYTSKCRTLFCYANITTQIVVYLFLIFWETQGMPSVTAYSNCMSYGCASETTAYKITYMKVFFAVTNACSAAVFLAIFCRYNSTRPQQKGPQSRRNNTNANRLAAFTLCLELVFSVLPNGISYAVWLANEILLSPMLGPYLAYVFATEVAVVTFVYVRVIGIQTRKGRVFNKTSSKSAIAVVGSKPTAVNSPTVLFF